MKTKWFRLIGVLVLVSMLVAPASAQYIPPATTDESPTYVKGYGEFQLADAIDLIQPARYIVLLKDASLARYTGGIIGLNATNPAARGESKLDVTSPDSRAYLAYLNAKQNAFLNEAKGLLGRGLQVDFRYDVILNGLAVVITPLEAQKLAAMPEVRLVLRETIEQVDTDAGPAFIGAPSIWNGETADGTDTLGEGIVVGILDTGINFDHPSFADPGPVDGYDYPAPAGGYKGVCAVSGGPYEHACNDKLIGAYTYTGEATSPEDANGHGSHTASTVAGNVVNLTFLGVATQISGVAPHAQIISYDVCDDSGCATAASAAAVQQAIMDGVDVINFSISGGREAYADPVELAFLDAFEAGVFVSASAGNLRTGEPSTDAMVNHRGPWVMTVAASSHNRKFTNDIDVVSPAPVPPEFTDMALLTGSSPHAFGALNDVELKWAGDDTSSSTPPFADNRQGCNAFPAGFFTGDVALIRRGTCTFAAKVDNAAAAGALGVLIYADHRPPLSPGGLETTTIPAGFLYLFPPDAAALEAWVDANAPVLVDISVLGRYVNDSWGDIKADFSYRGPNTTFDVLKPEITAPGLEILAAVADGVIAPDPDAEFELYQGTSMSAPHVAGSAALLAALHPTWSPAEIKSAIMLTAKNWDELRKEDGVTTADPFDFGSGRVNLTSAALVGLVMNETTANFEAADPALDGDPRTLNLASLNNSQCVGECSFTRTFRSVAAVPATYTVTVDAPAGMTVTVTPSNFTIGAGASQTVTFDVDVSAMTADEWAFATVHFNTDSTHPGGAPTELLSEGFESVTFPPTGWTAYDLDGGGKQWKRSTIRSHAPSTASALHSYSDALIDQDGWLVTPQVLLGENPVLSFWESTNWSTDYVYHGIHLSTASCNPNDGQFVEIEETSDIVEDTWQQQTVSLSAYAGQTVCLAFVYQGYYADEWFVDDVSLTSVSSGEPISDVHIPVAVLPTTGNLPGLVKFDSYRDTGAAVIPDLQAVEITDLTIDTYGFVKANLTQLNLAPDPTNGNAYDNLSQVYYQLIPLPDGAARVVAEITASTAPDVDLFWGYDSNGDGLPQASEQLGSSATGTAFEYLSDVWFPPLTRSLWVLVQNWQGSGTPTDAITLAVGVVPYDPVDPATMTVTGPASNPAGDLFSLTVSWHDIDTAEGDRLYGIFDVYTDDTYTTNVGYTEVDVRRKADDVTKTADKTTAFAGETITYTITIAPNMTAEDLMYTIKDTIPAGLVYVDGSVTGGATYNPVTNAIEWTGVMPGSTARHYVYTTSAQDPANCTLQILPDANPNAYLDWKTTSYGFSTSASISGDSFWYWAFSAYPAFNYFGADYVGMEFTADGYTLFDGISTSAINQQIPDPANPNNVMAMMWDDLVVNYDAATNKGVTLVGNSTSFATIEYDDVSLKSDPTKTMDVEIGYFLQPDDAPGAYEIIFAYENISDGFFTMATATVGVENVDGTAGTLVSYNDPTLTIPNGSAICFDWVPVVPEAKVITYQVKADGSVKGVIVNHVEHDNDGNGTIPETTSFPVMIWHQFFLPIISKP